MNCLLDGALAYRIYRLEAISASLAIFLCICWALLIAWQGYYHLWAKLGEEVKWTRSTRFVVWFSCALAVAAVCSNWEARTDATAFEQRDAWWIGAITAQGFAQSLWASLDQVSESARNTLHDSSVTSPAADGEQYMAC